MKTALKYVCQNFLEEGGLIRNIENLGHRELPNGMRAHKKRHSHGNYFCIQFESSVEAMEEINKKCSRTKEVIRCNILREQEPMRRPCLDGPCLFGEIPNPDHDRAAYTRKVLTRYKNRRVSNV